MSTALAKAAKGVVFVQAEVCKGCSYCIEFCPSHCLDFSKGFNRKGYHYPTLARPEDCSGCDMCGNYCPDFAIYGVRTKTLEAYRRASAAGATGVSQDAASSV